MITFVTSHDVINIAASPLFPLPNDTKSIIHNPDYSLALATKTEF